MGGLPPVTRFLLVANAAAFALAALGGEFLYVWFALWPFGSGFLPWQPVTYAFLHGDLLHIGFNMLGVWMFGADVERVLGRRRFIEYYAASILVAAAAQQATAVMTGAGAPTVGASGGLFGLLLAFALMFPNRIIVLLIPPVPLPAWLFVSLYGGLELFLGVTGTQSGVAHFAHLGGMAGGWLMIRYWQRRFPFG